jgi:hypothetical protein
MMTETVTSPNKSFTAALENSARPNVTIPALGSTITPIIAGDVRASNV